MAITEENNIIIEFSRDVMILGELRSSDIEVVVYKVINGRMLDVNYTKIEWELSNAIYEMLPARVLYLNLN